VIVKKAFESLKKWNRFLAGRLGDFQRMKPLKKEMRVLLQYEGDNGEYDKDYHEPLCDGHREPGNPLCTQHIGNQGQNEEYYRQPD
jgi:hypothetical protein